MMTYHVQFLLLVVAGWVNRQRQDVIDYQQEENRVLRAGLRGKRLKLSDDDRRRLAVKAQALSREALDQIASVATPAMPWCTTRDLGPQLSCTHGFEVPHEHFQTHSTEVCEEGL